LLKREDNQAVKMKHHLFTQTEGAHADSGVPKLALSVEQACQACDLGKTPLYQLLASGKLRSKKIGRRRLILFTDLRECLQSSFE
jgi:excisionase family DNA binding protein